MYVQFFDEVKQVEDRPQAPIVLRYFGEKGVALVAGLLSDSLSNVVRF